MMNQNLPPATTPNPSTSDPSSRQAAKPTKLLLLSVIVIALIGLFVPMFFYLWPEFGRNALLDDGVPAQAEVLSIEPTGNLFNQQPQVRISLRVIPEEGESYEAVVTMIINPVYLSKFQPGNTIQVRYDAEDRTNVAIDETQAGMR